MVTLLDMMDQQDPEKRRKMAWEKALQDLGTAGHPMSITPLGILYRTYRDGPGALQSMWGTVKTPGDIAAGEKPATVEDAAKFALDVGLVGLTGTAPKGALRSGLARGANRLYHGADTKITNFHVAPRRISSMGDGVYLTTRPEKAARYGNVIHSVKADGKLLNWAKPEKKVIEAIKKEVKLPPNKIAGFGPVRREVFNIGDPLAERRFLELKKMTEGFYHDRAKAKLVDVGDGKVAIEWRDPGLDNANGENLMHLLQEAGVDMRKLALDLGYDGAKFGDEVVIFDASKAKVIGVE